VVLRVNREGRTEREGLDLLSFPFEKGRSPKRTGVSITVQLVLINFLTNIVIQVATTAIQVGVGPEPGGQTGLLHNANCWH